MKKALAFLLIFLITICLTACGDAREPLYSQTDRTAAGAAGIGSADGEELNELLPIYNAQNEKIGEINLFGTVMPTNGGFVYTVHSGSAMEYYQYTVSNQESVKLGSVENWAMQPNEAVFLHNHLFIFVMTGGGETQILKLLDLDLENHTLSEVFSEEGGFPYNTMIGSGDKLLIARALTNETCIQEYNVLTNEMKDLKRIPFDDARGVGEAVRHICADKDTISLLMPVIKDENSVRLQVNVYDTAMSLLNSADISDISADPNELRQGVSNFVFSDGLLYYENFSMTRFLGRVTDTGLEKCMDVDSLYVMAYETAQVPETKLLCRLYDESNALYLVDMKTGDIRKGSFFADDKRYQFYNMYRDATGNVIMLMGYRHPDTGAELEPRLYYVSESDLHFS